MLDKLQTVIGSRSASRHPTQLGYQTAHADNSDVVAPRIAFVSEADHEGPIWLKILASMIETLVQFWRQTALDLDGQEIAAGHLDSVVIVPLSTCASKI